MDSAFLKTNTQRIPLSARWSESFTDAIHWRRALKIKQLKHEQIQWFTVMIKKASKELTKWVVATRLWSVPASIAPLFIVLAWLYATQSNGIRWGLAPLVFFSVVLFQLAGNLISDYFDFTHGVDTIETAGSRTLPEGIFRPRTILYYGITLLGIASVTGLYLAYESGLTLVCFGMFGILAAAFYYKIKFRGLGVFLIFVVFGPCIALGTEYTLTTRLSWSVLLLSFPIGLLTTAILHANDIRDMPHDQTAGIYTFALGIGRENAELIYRMLIIIPYLLIGFYIVLGILPPVAITVLATLPLASSAVRILNDSEKMKDLDRKTAMLQLVFSVVVIASIGSVQQINL